MEWDWLLTPWPGSDRRAEEEGRPVGPAGWGQCPAPPPLRTAPLEGGDLGRAGLAGASPWCGDQGGQQRSQYAIAMCHVNTLLHNMLIIVYIFWRKDAREER